VKGYNVPQPEESNLELESMVVIKIKWNLYFAQMASVWMLSSLFLVNLVEWAIAVHSMHESF